MAKRNNPRHGSMQFWPRVRANRPYARIRNWVQIKDAKPLGFAGYKVGMTHVLYTDNKKTSMTKGEDISCPVTIIECPPLKVFSVKFYKTVVSDSQVVAEILAEKDLPKKYFAYSACFRREAGSYRTEERGMVRGHQFNKIEMFQFTLPANSRPAFDELVNAAVKLAQGLGLHFRTVLLAAADASAAMSKTVDIEVYIPSMGGYKEISSVSNALDYQARRANVRFKNQKTGKNEFVHTLNGSGLATSRLVPAILEQFQQKDGSIEIPKALRKYCGFKRILK